MAFLLASMWKMILNKSTVKLLHQCPSLQGKRLLQAIDHTLRNAKFYLHSLLGATGQTLVICKRLTEFQMCNPTDVRSGF